jgi:hypothetical protein
LPDWDNLRPIFQFIEIICPLLHHLAPFVEQAPRSVASTSFGVFGDGLCATMSKCLESGIGPIIKISGVEA